MSSWNSTSFSTPQNREKKKIARHEVRSPNENYHVWLVFETRDKILLSHPETSLTSPRLLPLRRSRRSYQNYRSSRNDCGDRGDPDDHRETRLQFYRRCNNLLDQVHPSYYLLSVVYKRPHRILVWTCLKKLQLSDDTAFLVKKDPSFNSVKSGPQANI